MGLKTALKQFKGKKVIVAGDILLDKYLDGVIERVNPEQPASPLFKVTGINYRLGGAANVARNVSSLEAECLLYGVVGKDLDGEKIIDMCKNQGISPMTYKISQPTIVKERFIAHGQQVMRADHGEVERINVNEEYKKELLLSIESNLRNQKIEALIFSDYNKGFLDRDFVMETIKLTKRKNVPIFVDSKPVNVDLFKGSTLIRMNEREAEEISGISYEHNGKRLEKIARNILKRVGSDYCVITCSGKGVFCYDQKKQEHMMVPTQARAVSDVTGAGDTFTATLALGMVSGLYIFDASKLANYAAGNVVEKLGTATTSIKEIYQRLG